MSSEFPQEGRGEGESGQWVMRHRDGVSVPLREGGFADQVFQSLVGHRERSIEAGLMDWTIGYLADLCWMTVPETRDGIGELMKEEIDAATRQGRFLIPLRWYQVCEVLCDVLISSLAKKDEGSDVAFRCLDVVARVIREAGGSYRSNFDEDIIKPVKRAGFWAAVEEVHPELIRLMQSDPEWCVLLEDDRY